MLDLTCVESRPSIIISWRADLLHSVDLAKLLDWCQLSLACRLLVELNIHGDHCMAASSWLVPVAKLKTGAVLSVTLAELEGITVTAGEVT